MDLCNANIHIVGLGALGSAVASLLCEAGARRLTLQDFDIVQESNLVRTTYTQKEIGALKVDALKAQLLKKWPELEITTIATMFTGETCADLLIDGTDNLHARLVLNDAARKNDIPLIIAAAAKDRGLVFPVIGTPCWQCIALGKVATDSCEDGIEQATIAEVVARQATLARTIFERAITPHLFLIAGRTRELIVTPDHRCAACKGTYTYLDAPYTLFWCAGTKRIQARPTRPTTIDLTVLDASERYSQAARVDLESGSALVHAHGLVEFDGVPQDTAEDFMKKIRKQDHA